MSHTHRINIASDRTDAKQQKLSEIFLSKSNSIVPVKSQRQDDRFLLARRMALWFSRDLLPFSLAGNKGFGDFWDSLHVGIPLPSRQTISIAALDDMYDCMKTELKSILSTAGGKELYFHFSSFSRYIVSNFPRAYLFHATRAFFFQCTVL